MSEDRVQRKASLAPRGREPAHTPLRGRPRRRGPSTLPWQKPETIEDDWRTPTLRYRMSSKLSAGMPDDMKEALRRAAFRLGLSMSEVVRRLLAKEGL